MSRKKYRLCIWGDLFRATLNNGKLMYALPGAHCVRSRDFIHRGQNYEYKTHIEHSHIEYDRWGIYAQARSNDNP